MSGGLDLTGCKKRKRSERVYKFKTFGEHGCPAGFDSHNFEENVRTFLEYAKPENGLCGAMPSWSFQLEVHRHPPSYVFLFVVEEPIELSLNPKCKHCQYIGWGDHLICNKKYHFVFPSKDTMAACFSFCQRQSSSNLYGGGAATNSTSEIQRPNVMMIELEGHTMHGVFHCNGFGHLLCINGLESGSNLAGHHIMDFWDRLCTGLHARSVSLKDGSEKRGMDLRLLYAVGYGEAWFGRWGYKFGHGSFAVNHQMYETAVQTVQNIPLTLLAHHSPNQHELLIILSRYQILSGHSLGTLHDAFHFMLELKSRIPKDETNLGACYPGLLVVDSTCRWSPKRVEMAIRVIVEALKRADYRWVSRQQVRDAARSYIGDTGLLDFVLKSLGNHIVGKYLVRRCLNPVTKVLEYCLEDISNAFPKHEEIQGGVRVRNDSQMKPRYKITRVQLMKDVQFLYKHILTEENGAGVLATIPAASRVILDAKYFLKDYTTPKLSETSDKLVVWCAIKLGFNQERVVTPYECMVLGKGTTFDELRLEVEKTFREMYWGLRVNNFVANLNIAPNGCDSVLEAIKEGSNCKLVFEGFVGGENVDYGGMFEGIDKSSIIVDCPCGTRDEDDGERMVCCDICEVWQHTRCVHIPNNQPIPDIFLCTKCEQHILRFPSLP
nr:PHD finger protein MALE STERILITY 1 [Ipomoea batatas]